MKRFFHILKVKFLRIKWYFDLIGFAMKHSKEVDNYKFLVGIREAAHERYLEIDRVDSTDPDIEKLKTQIALLDKILDYVK